MRYIPNHMDTHDLVLSSDMTIIFFGDVTGAAAYAQKWISRAKYEADYDNWYPVESVLIEPIQD